MLRRLRVATGGRDTHNAAIADWILIALESEGRLPRDALRATQGTKSNHEEHPPQKRNIAIPASTVV
jgi:hypothetical protein